MHPVFSKGMVLQRNVENTIWGWASAGEVVNVDIGNYSVKTTAGKTGQWSVNIKPFSKGGPHVMTVSSVTNGTKTSIDVTNIADGNYIWNVQVVQLHCVCLSLVRLQDVT